MAHYTKTTYQVSVLSEEPISEELTLDHVLRQAVDGNLVRFDEVVVSTIELTPEQMAQELIDSGSDPDFFGLGDHLG